MATAQRRMNSTERLRDTTVLNFGGVSVIRDERVVVDHVDWTMGADERWVVLGRNGSGKTTLIRIAALYDHPSSGSVQVLGETLGRCDVRTLRRRIGFVSAAMADLVRPELLVADVVMCAKYAALEPYWHDYDAADRERALMLCERVGIGHAALRPFQTLSSGERQQAMIARQQMSLDIGLMLFDEPMAGLDLGAREGFIRRLSELALDSSQPPMALVTHHVEEIPTGITHALLIHQGKVLASGALDDTLTAANLSACFEVDLRLARRAGRWTAWGDGG